MSISERLLKILVCPETKLPVAVAPETLISQLNQKIQSGALKNRGGRAIAESLDNGLLRSDGKCLYPVYRDIPVMLVEEAIDL